MEPRKTPEIGDVARESEQRAATSDHAVTRILDQLGPLVPAPSPRTTMIAMLAQQAAEAAAVGDMDAARVAHEAMGRLLAAPATTKPRSTGT